MIVLGQQYPYGGAKNIVVLEEGSDLDTYINSGWIVLDRAVVITESEAWSKYTRREGRRREFKKAPRHRRGNALSFGEAAEHRRRCSREHIRQLCKSIHGECMDTL